MPKTECGKDIVGLGSETAPLIPRLDAHPISRRDSVLYRPGMMRQLVWPDTGIRRSQATLNTVHGKNENPERRRKGA